MDSKRLEDKVDKIVEKIGNIDVTLAKQSVILEEHVKRTNLLEARIEPVVKHVAIMKAMAKIVGFMGLGAIAKIIHEIVTKGM